MRVLTWIVLVGMSSASVWRGQLADALAIAGLKALLVGWEFMELRVAARPHAVAWTLYVACCVLGLSIATR